MRFFISSKMGDQQPEKPPLSDDQQPQEPPPGYHQPTLYDLQQQQVQRQQVQQQQPMPVATVLTPEMAKEKAKIHSQAVAAIVMGIFGSCWCTVWVCAIPACVLGGIALSKLNNPRSEGCNASTLALAGLICVIICIATLLCCIIYIILLATAVVHAEWWQELKG